MIIQQAPKITDITKLFQDYLEDINIPNQFYFWYRSNNISEIKLEIKNLNTEPLDNPEFPEYKPIALASLNYFYNNPEFSNNPGFTLLNIMVDEKSKFAKNHDADDSGFIRLFSLYIYKLNKSYGKKSTKYKLCQIQINPILITEKIILSNGTKPYPVSFHDVEIDNLETNSKNNINNPDLFCVICMGNKYNFMETACHHKFHLNCLRLCPKLRCPICRADIIPDLKTNGINPSEINSRLADEKLESEYQDHIFALTNTDLTDLSDIEFIKYSMESIRLNSGDISSYHYMLVEMVASCSNLFSEISNLKPEPGIFLYLYESPVDFILHLKSETTPSIAVWTSLNSLKNTYLDSLVKPKYDLIKNKSEFLVVVVIDNIINIEILNKDSYNTEIGQKLNQFDILITLACATRCRSPDNLKYPVNRELKWARNILNKIKYKNNIKKNNYKTKSYKYQA